MSDVFIIPKLDNLGIEEIKINAIPDSEKKEFCKKRTIKEKDNIGGEGNRNIDEKICHSP
ncbi:MAG: hypothetical protein HEEMFOPI_01596 [Holosporales bacterium]